MLNVDDCNYLIGLLAQEEKNIARRKWRMSEKAMARVALSNVYEKLKRVREEARAQESEDPSLQSSDL